MEQNNQNKTVDSSESSYIDQPQKSVVGKSIQIFLMILIVGLIGFGGYFGYNYWMSYLGKQTDSVASRLLQRPNLVEDESKTESEDDQSRAITPTTQKYYGITENTNAATPVAPAVKGITAPTPTPTPVATPRVTPKPTTRVVEEELDLDDAEFDIDNPDVDEDDDYYRFEYTFDMNREAEKLLEDGFSFKVKHSCEEWLEEDDNYFDGKYTSRDSIRSGLGFTVKLHEDALNDDDLFETSEYRIYDESGDVVFSGSVKTPDCK